MRAHWTKQAEMAKYAHQSLLEALLSIDWTPYTTTVNIHITAYLKRPMDSDNICDKLLIDGIKLRGLIVDDNPDYVVTTSTTSIKSKTDYTVIQIE